MDFKILVDKIIQLFPTEVRATYYIPRIPGTKTTKPVNARGKLIDKYRNTRHLYKLLNKDKDEESINDEQTPTIDGIRISFLNFNK